MTEQQLTELRKDIIARHSHGLVRRPLTNLELREYKRLMKRVCENDPFIKNVD